MTNDRTTEEPEETGGSLSPDSDAVPIATGDHETLDSRARYSFELITGDAALIGGLTDEAAQVLLDGALDEARRLVAPTRGMEECAAQAALASRIRL